MADLRAETLGSTAVGIALQAFKRPLSTLRVLSCDESCRCGLIAPLAARDFTLSYIFKHMIPLYLLKARRTFQLPTTLYLLIVRLKRMNVHARPQSARGLTNVLCASRITRLSVKLF